MQSRRRDKGMSTAKQHPSKSSPPLKNRRDNERPLQRHVFSDERRLRKSPTGRSLCDMRPYHSHPIQRHHGSLQNVGGPAPSVENIKIKRHMFRPPSPPKSQERPLQPKPSSKGTKDPTDPLGSRPLSGSQAVTATRCRNTAFAHGHLLESKMFRGFMNC